MIGTWSFQSRLGIICHTLMNILAPISHLVILLTIILTMFSMAACILLGHRLVTLSTLEDAIVVSLSVG